MNELQKLDDVALSNLKRIFASEDSTFKVITSEKLGELSAGMPEIQRAMQSFCKTNSQTTASLMTLTMLTGGPYRVLRQILAQVKMKMAALREAYFGMREKELLAKKQRQKAEGKKDPIDKELCLVKAQSLEGQIIDTKDALEAALKEIGMYQEAYNQIREANGIRENWDEADFEAAEVAHHIRCAFRLAVRDVMGSGRLNVATSEYMEAFGINPIQANVEVDKYFNEMKKVLSQSKEVPIGSLHKFLDEMAAKYADAWKATASRLGLKTITFERWLYTEDA